MTVSTALLESVVQQLAGSLLETSQRIGQIVTCELSFRRLLDLTRSLYLQRRGRDSGFAKLNELVHRADNLYDMRNVITHSVWAVGDDRFAATRIRLTARGKSGFKAEFAKIKAGQVADLARDIQELAWEIQEYWSLQFSGRDV